MAGGLCDTTWSKINGATAPMVLKINKKKNSQKEANRLVKQ